MWRKILLLVILVVIILGLVLYHYSENFTNKDVLVLYGNVDVRRVDLGFRIDGRVQSMIFEEGDLVPKGKLMAFLEKPPYDDQLRQAQANVESAKLTLENADKILKRRQELVTEGGVAREDYENALSSRDVYAANVLQAEASLGVAQTNIKDTELFCPTVGIILTRIREPGTVVSVSNPIYTLSILSPVWIRAFVSEPDLGRIYPGMRAEIYTDTPGGKIYKGHIGFISPVSEFTPKTVEATSCAQT